MEARHGAFAALRAHWRHYAIEGAALGTFMAVAGTVAVLLARIPEPLHSTFAAHATLHRLVFGVVMGLTAIAIIYSPWGQRSGAHINPSVTIAYFILGKSAFWDACFYVVAQFLGAVLGFALVASVLRPTLSLPSVHYIVTRPGVLGSTGALLAEFAIAFLLMTTILHVSNSSRFARFTGLCAGLLVVLYITVEAPLSGMSMNPARTLATAVAAGDATAIWVYFLAPPLGMLAAALIYARMRGPGSVRCAKLYHTNIDSCIFRCGYRQQQEHGYA